MALQEDCPVDDVTVSLLNEDRLISAQVISRERGIFSGVRWLQTILDSFSDQLSGRVLLSEGDLLQKGTVLLQLRGSSHHIIKIERVLLNLLQHLCGIATLTAHYVEALSDPAISILDTRKTMPLWRDLEKQAVLAGGGCNHRENLSDMILIKENHLTAFLMQDSLESFSKLLIQSKQARPDLLIELELETLEQCQCYPLEGVDFVLLDNFSLEDVDLAVDILKKRDFSGKIEISGSVTIDTISFYRGKSIDRISVGALTHSAPVVDLSLLVEEVNA